MIFLFVGVLNIKLKKYIQFCSNKRLSLKQNVMWMEDAKFFFSFFVHISIFIVLIVLKFRR